MIQSRRARRDLLRHLLADEPRPLPAGRGRPRPRARTTSRSSCTGSDKPLVEVSATGRSVYQEGVHETAFLTLRFEGGTQANVQLSWLAPRKMRQMVVVGSKRMVQYEDTAADDSVRVYDRGPRLRRAAGQLRRVPPHLPQRRHGRAADPGAGAAGPGAAGLRLGDQRGHHAGLQRRASGSRSCSAWRRWSSRWQPGRTGRGPPRRRGAGGAGAADPLAAATPQRRA